ncbi:helix-turn-helix domain-containing protein [Sorangium sp. So ce726]|uniref:TetR/AcrR family transcriptional regulator n=1 Tax=Sorangium sp. So ce726 TaxID=3133319 RepID=UPI003F5E7BBC
MAQSGDSSSSKPLRADARRNREALLATAREAFTAGELDIRIEEIARRAGVGVGTLYRHFETREVLIEAVYRQEIDALYASTADLMARLPADEALSAFLHHLVRLRAANVGLGKILMAIMSASSIGYAYGDQRLQEALERLMAAAANTGRIRADVAPQTVVMALRSLCIINDEPEWEDQAGAMIDLILDGLRFGAAAKRK